MKVLKWYEIFLSQILFIVGLYLTIDFYKRGLSSFYLIIPSVAYSIGLSIWLLKNKNRFSKAFIISEIAIMLLWIIFILYLIFSK